MKKLFFNIICLLLIVNAAWAQSMASANPKATNLAASAENVSDPVVDLLKNIDLNQMYFGQIEISEVKGINSRKPDFSPMPVENGIVFTSSRKKIGLFKRTDNSSGMPFTDLYFMAKKEDGTYSKARRLFEKVNRKYHDGTAVFSGDQMFFTRNNLKGKNSKKMVDLKIYEATLKDGKWRDASELPFNSDEFATCHPTLSPDGTMMVFSSNRPGGFGGMDLWSTTRNGNEWSEPVNLGAQINSAKNEIFPFMDSQGALFFASNGWVGFGGLDLFVSQNDKNQWNAPTNLGRGMNSEKDDFGIWVSTDGTSGYFSSDRLGGKGKDDIYQWKATDAIPVLTAKKGKSNLTSVIVVDAQTNEPISGASINWAELTQNVGIVLSENQNMTKPDGMLLVNAMPSRKYAFNVAKDGYLPKNVNTTSIELTAPGSYYIPMEKAGISMMNGSVVDAMSGGLIPSADVEMLNLCDNSVAIYRTDASGNFDFEADCNCSYKMKASKNGYTVSSKTIEKTCTPGSAKIALAAPYIAPTAPRAPAAPTNKYGVSNFYEGQMLTLHDVYYDFDKWYIRDDAAAELNHLVSVMRQYPSLKIELGSHTDARGNDEYNRKLSQKRADAAVKYIISQGISSSRLTAKGYGETMVTNQCENGVKCSDEEHQANRRTEVRVTSIASGVDVRDQH